MPRRERERGERVRPRALGDAVRRARGGQRRERHRAPREERDVSVRVRGGVDRLEQVRGVIFEKTGVRRAQRPKRAQHPKRRRAVTPLEGRRGERARASGEGGRRRARRPRRVDRGRRRSRRRRAPFVRRRPRERRREKEADGDEREGGVEEARKARARVERPLARLRREHVPPEGCRGYGARRGSVRGGDVRILTVRRRFVVAVEGRVDVREDDEVGGGARREEDLRETHRRQGLAPDENGANEELTRGAEDEEGLEPEGCAERRGGEVTRRGEVRVEGEDVVRDLRVREPLDVREVGDWGRTTERVGGARDEEGQRSGEEETRSRGRGGGSRRAGRGERAASEAAGGRARASRPARGGGHPPRCGSEGLKCTKKANAHAWRVVRFSPEEKRAAPRGRRRRPSRGGAPGQARRARRRRPER